MKVTVKVLLNQTSTFMDYSPGDERPEAISFQSS